MYDILKFKIGTAPLPTLNEAPPASPAPDPYDPWLFTDPAAKELYIQQNRLPELEEDIFTYVMYNGCWAEEELAFKRELQRLLAAGVLYAKNTFGYLSPHPTVYRAKQEAMIKVGAFRVHVHPGEDIIFQTWLERVSAPRFYGPIHTGRLQTIAEPRLCRESFLNICQLCRQEIAILHNMLPKAYA